MMRLALPLALLPAICAHASAQPLLEHSHEWVQTRAAQMLAVDDAYLWHEVLGGRAIHQNSNANPPTEPLEGNFHTQQQAFFAAVKMDLFVLGGRTDTRQLDDARDLLAWVLANGYDGGQRQFYLKYNQRSGEWQRDFFPEFNMITVAALLQYNALRPTPEFVAAAENVLGRIAQSAPFRPDARQDIYASGYIALKLLDAWEATGEARFLELARTVLEIANAALWDEQYGGWHWTSTDTGAAPTPATKFTHTNANLIQANLRLFLAEGGEVYRERALRTLELLAQHSRSPDGGWYRHNTRDWSDPARPPGVGDGGTTETGALCVYDRMAQMMVACALAWRATEDRRYLRWIDETLAKMERTHLTVYPVGVNYGYISSGDTQNTWCHLWGLKAMIAIDRLWRDYGAGAA